MSKKRIDEMSMKQIAQKFGFPLLLMYNKDKVGNTINTEHSLRITYNYDIDIDSAFEFESKIKQIAKNGSIEEKASKLLDLIDEYECLFDKKLYLLYVSKLLQNEVGTKKGSFNSKPSKHYLHISDKNVDLEKLLQEEKDMLFNEDVVLISCRTMDDYEFSSSQEFIGRKKFIIDRKRNADRQLKKIEAKYPLEEITKYVVPALMSEFFKYQNVANFFIINLYRQSQPNDAAVDSGAYQVLIDSNVGGADQLIDINQVQEVDQFKNFDQKKYIDILRKNSEFIDLDKLLLMYCTIWIYKIRDKDGSYKYDDYIKVKNLVEDVEKNLLENKNVSIVFSDKNDVNFDDIKIILNMLSQSFINKKFYKTEELASILKQIETGEIQIDSIPPEDFKSAFHLGILDSYEHELNIINNQPNGLEYLIENNILNEECIKKILMCKDDYTVNQLLYLMNKKILQQDDIIKFFDEGKITSENIKLLKKELENTEMPLQLSKEKLVELYLDPERKEEFDAYRKIFKVLEIDETLEEINSLKENEDDGEKVKKIKAEILKRKKAIGEEILSQSDSLIDNDKMYDLYHMGLLQIDTIVEYIGIDSVSTLYASGELKPIDAKRLYDNQILTIEMIKEILTKNNISEGNKLGLIYSTFPSNDKEDVDIREELLQYMKQLDETITFESQPKNWDPKEKNHVSKITYNRYFSDPCARWNLMSSLDSEYSQEFLKNGWIVFYLPNEDKYIVEKLYAKDYSPAYGAATYILSQKTFKTYRDDIIKDKFVDRSFLVKLEKDKTEGVKKIIHTGWGNAIIKYFSIDEKERYSEKEKEKIRMLAQEVEKSKKPLNKENEEK